MQQTCNSSQPLPLTELEIKGLCAIHTWHYALVDMRYKQVACRNDGFALPLVVYFDEGCIYLIEILRKINSNPNNPLCNNLQLVRNPYL